MQEKRTREWYSVAAAAFGFCSLAAVALAARGSPFGTIALVVLVLGIAAMPFAIRFDRQRRRPDGRAALRGREVILVALFLFFVPVPAITFTNAAPAGAVIIGAMTLVIAAAATTRLRRKRTGG